MHILADIGGTKIRIAGTEEAGSFGEPVILDTPQSYRGGILALSQAIQSIAHGTLVEGIITGIRGVVAQDHQSMVRDSVLPDWAQKPLASDLKTAVRAGSVHVENDVALVGLGEAMYGAGKGASIVAYITVSTGVNGSRILDGHIDRSHEGFEIGGQYLSMQPARTLEECVSGASVRERFGVNPRDLGKDNPVWEELAEQLAYGVHNTIVHWSPDHVVLGGSMLNEIGISVERVQEHVAKIMRKFPSVPEIVHSSLGDLGGLWGGLALLKQQGLPPSDA